MTSITFEGIYDEVMLRKMKTSDLKKIWKRLCSPPSLKEHIIQDILRYQKKNKHEKLFSAIEAEVNRSHHARRETMNSNHLDAKDHKDRRKLNTPHHRRGRSAPQRLLLGIEEIKTKETGERLTVKEQLMQSKSSRVYRRRTELGIKSGGKRNKASRYSRKIGSSIEPLSEIGSSLALDDIHISGLDIIAEKEREAESKALGLHQLKSHEFHIKPPTNRSQEEIKFIS